MRVSKLVHMKNNQVAFQGEHGANSELALKKVMPAAKSVPCVTFEAVFTALTSGEVEYAFIPVENSVAGRVADIHYLLPKAEIAILSEHFEPIEHMLMAPSGATLDTIKEVHSHVHALGQCRECITQKGLTSIVHPDTAGAAADVAKWGDPTKAAIASSLASELYDLEILAKNIEDANHNTTRFLLIARGQQQEFPSQDADVITSMFVTLRSVPSALFKAIGGFATNGINMTRLESYVSGERFSVAQFILDVEGHPDTPAMQHALEELRFFSSEVKMLGTYPASPFRRR